MLYFYTLHSCSFFILLGHHRRHITNLS